MSAAQPFATNMDPDNKRYVARLLLLHRQGDSLPPRWTAADFSARWAALGLPPYRPASTEGGRA